MRVSPAAPRGVSGGVNTVVKFSALLQALPRAGPPGAAVRDDEPPPGCVAQHAPGASFRATERTALLLRRRRSKLAGTWAGTGMGATGNSQTVALWLTPDGAYTIQAGPWTA